MRALLVRLNAAARCTKVTKNIYDMDFHLNKDFQIRMIRKFILFIWFKREERCATYFSLGPAFREGNYIDRRRGIFDP